MPAVVWYWSNSLIYSTDTVVLLLVQHCFITLSSKIARLCIYIVFVFRMLDCVSFNTSSVVQTLPHRVSYHITTFQFIYLDNFHHINCIFKDLWSRTYDKVTPLLLPTSKMYLIYIKLLLPLDKIVCIFWNSYYLFAYTI